MLAIGATAPMVLSLKARVSILRLTRFRLRFFLSLSLSSSLFLSSHKRLLYLEPIESKFTELGMLFVRFNID